MIKHNRRNGSNCEAFKRKFHPKPFLHNLEIPGAFHEREKPCSCNCSPPFVPALIRTAIPRADYLRSLRSPRIRRGGRGSPLSLKSYSLTSAPNCWPQIIAAYGADVLRTDEEFGTGFGQNQVGWRSSLRQSIGPTDLRLS